MTLTQSQREYLLEISKSAFEAIEEMVAELDGDDQEEARERILEDALDITLTGSWSLGETPEATGYEILLTTGGPAVRIVGDLESGEPTSAELQVQDWGTPWTECADPDWDYAEDTLLEYARCFYFGE